MYMYKYWYMLFMGPFIGAAVPCFPEIGPLTFACTSVQPALGAFNCDSRPHEMTLDYILMALIWRYLEASGG